MVIPRIERRTLYHVAEGNSYLEVDKRRPAPDFGSMTWTLEPYGSNHRSACVAIFESNVPEFVTKLERGQFAGFVDERICPYFVVKATGEPGLQSSETGSPGSEPGLPGDGVVIACGGYHLGQDGARLCWGLVQRDLHHRGIGRFLLRSRLIRIYDECGDTVVTMDTSQLTSAFFERFGFRVVDRAEHGYGIESHKLEMELKLDGQAAEKLR